MKEEKGITLVSLIIYVILMTFVIAAVSGITASFNTNLNEFDSESESAVAYSKFNMYFITDIKRNESEIVEYYDDYIILSYVVEEDTTNNNTGVTVQSGTTVKIEYSVQNNALYRNKVKICGNVDDILITADTTKKTVNISIVIDGYEKTTTYKLESFGVDEDSGGQVV